MGFVAVDIDGVVQQVVLISRLCAVVGECPVDEIVDLADESDVVVDGAVMVGRSQQRTVLPVDPARIPLHAVIDLGPVIQPPDLVPQLVIHGHVSIPLPLIRLTAAETDFTLEQIFGQQSLPRVRRSSVAKDALSNGSQGLGLLASALAGRPMAVAEQQPGEPPWTDGQTVYVDGAASSRAKLEAVAVQASMIAAGSLDPDVVRPLVRHPRLARRYLAIEAHRALVSNADLLPRVLVSLGDRDIASRSDSPATSLSIAAGRAAVEDPAPGFGVIRAAKVLAASSRAAEQQGQKNPQHVPRDRRAHELEELDDGETDDSDDPDLFTSPVGGGGFIGKWLKKMLSSTRKSRSSGGGPPGADTPTHRTNSANRGLHAVSSLASVSSEDVDDRP